jgi:hypothetical protein
MHLKIMSESPLGDAILDLTTKRRFSPLDVRCRTPVALGTVPTNRRRHLYLSTMARP